MTKSENLAKNLLPQFFVCQNKPADEENAEDGDNGEQEHDKLQELTGHVRGQGTTVLVVSRRIVHHF